MRDPFPIGANPRALDPPSLGEAGSGLRVPPPPDEYDGHRVLRGVALAALLCAAFWLLVTGRIAGWW